MFKKARPKIDLSLDGIKKFIAFAGQFPVSSLSAGRPGARITVYQNPAAANAPAAAKTPAAEEHKAESFARIKSDTVGIYVPVKGIAAGSPVAKGQVVAKISAMKIESDITADRDCVIKEALAQANDRIEYGQPLFFIE
ncbi:MAG: acetyl-CoA carboxylase biotin carboxyl carrier protein subunit [Candidatus Margulisbacteria bacterium]|jgi:biotin carboxyl carrier protein|nr:acetyl-CoA carboxylase biotin carboxyl carrier protein subunit [Candidatus Margulisiibacteriota bacterium]